MERRGLRAAAPDRRRDHVAPAHRRARSRPAYSHETVHVLDASRVVDVVSGAPRPARRGGARRARTASSRSGCACSTRRSCSGRCCRSPRRAQTAPGSPSTTCRRRRSPARATIEPDARGARAVHRLAVLLPRLGPEGQVPGDPRQPGRARALRRRAGDARRDRRAAAVSRPAASTASGPRTPTATTSSSTARGSASCASRRITATSRPNRCLADYVAPDGDCGGRLRRCDPRCRRARRRGRGRARRLPGDHRQGARRPVRRGVRRMAAPSGRGASGTHPTSSSPATICSQSGSAGIRPAFGYPACPDHSEKGKLFDLLGAAKIGIELTESYAMTPAAAVSGIYLAHPTRGTSPSAGSGTIRSRTTPSARVRRWTRSNDGCDRICLEQLGPRLESVLQVERWLRRSLSLQAFCSPWCAQRLRRRTTRLSRSRRRTRQEPRRRCCSSSRLRRRLAQGAGARRAS